MKLVIPPNGYVLTIGNPTRSTLLAESLDNRVLALVPTVHPQKNYRQLAWCDSIEDLMPAVPVFSAVVIDHSNVKENEIREHTLKRHWEWASQFVVPGGWFIVYGDAQCMPASCYAWDDSRIERTVRWGPTREHENFSVVCCGVARVTLAQLKGNIKAQCNVSEEWHDKLCLMCPPAHRTAATTERSEYTDDEMQVLGQTDTALLDLAAVGYRVTSIEQPPMELGVGHLGLMIASGQLAGKIHTPGKEPHVMRGISRKVERSKTDDRGRTVTTEQVEIVVRTVDNKGKLQEYTA